MRRPSGAPGLPRCGGPQRATRAPLFSLGALPPTAAPPAPARPPAELIYDDLCYDSREAVSRLASPSDPHAVAVRHAAAPHHSQHEAGGVCMVSPERSAKPYREAPYRGQQMEIEAYEPRSPRSGPEGSPAARCVNGAALERARSARSSTPGSAGRTSVTPSSEPGGLGVNSQELLSALRLIAANPACASKLPPLETPAGGGRENLRM